MSGVLGHREKLGWGVGFGKDFPVQITQSALAAMIDHTLLKAEATRADIESLCREAAQYGFASVCVQPSRVSAAAKFLHNHKAKVCTVIGFPLGASVERTKAFEALAAVEDGADELDMVINIGALKDRDHVTAESDIRAVVRAAQGRLVKVILETCLLTEDEIVLACKMSVNAGAGFVKTSTGLSTAGATVEHIALMRATVGPDLGVKASGGLRDIKKVLSMIEAGASRIGTSSGVALMEGLPASKDGY